MGGNSGSGKGAVMITGASTGIGRACALHLDGLGFDVFAGVRKESDGEALRKLASDRLVPLLIDVTDGASIEAAAKQVREAVGEKGLAGLINNAGVVVSGPLEFVPLDELRQQIEINVIGQVAVTQAFLPLLRKRKGRIVNMGSIGGKIALPFVGPYAASKFALEAITDSFRRELRGTGIEVSILQPGGVATPIWAKGEAQADEQRRQMSEEAQALYGTAMDKMAETARKTGAAAIPPEEVAKVVEHALTAPKPKTRYLVGKEAKIQATLRKVLSDRALDGFLAKFIGL